jgi:hypothetical protein
MTFDEMERALRQRLEALPPAARAELIYVLRLPDFDRADRIGEFWGHPATRTFGELLIDLEEDRYAKAVVWGAAQRDGAAVAIQQRAVRRGHSGMTHDGWPRRPPLVEPSTRTADGLATSNPRCLRALESRA